MRLKFLLKTYVFSLFIVALLLGISVNTFAATTQGAPGPLSSTGTVDINVTSGDDIIIYGLQTVSFGAWTTGDGDQASNQDVCIGKSGFFEPYAIQATGDGNTIDPSAFTLTNGVDQINYEVYWNDATGLGGQIQLLPGSVQYGQTGIPADFFWNRLLGFFGFPCGAGPSTPNANLEVRISSTELSAAPAGIYTGVLTLLVIPN